MSPRRTVVVILPDIRSTHNTGSFFRTSDGAGVSKIYLTGITAAPPHPHLVKVSLGAEAVVPWEYHEDVLSVIAKLRAEGFQIVAVEQTPESVHYKKAEYSQKVAVIFGNEVTGLSDEVINTCDLVVDIPMFGKKESLNVSIAGGIILYHLMQD
ncbi:MAG: RNA methyltransferase [Candidatus Kerfeldbacteria bacterium]|nr:RNA methyltransferase [Candidatus Kerfeldbacteria bacterium]